LNEGYDVISADISLEALNKLKTKVAKAKTIKLDMNKPLEFKDKEFELVLANLSTHYFNWNDTFKLYDEIKRILKNGGYFIGRVNSTETVDDNVKNSTIIEENFYFNKKYMRFFNKEQFDKLFENCDIIILNEITTKRLGREKNIWEFIVKNR
jgi:ubiquinone/menaquinone biosynthesis C-methylase UbiE